MDENNPGRPAMGISSMELSAGDDLTIQLQAWKGSTCYDGLMSPRRPVGLN